MEGKAGIGRGRWWEGWKGREAGRESCSLDERLPRRMGLSVCSVMLLSGSSIPV